MSPFMRSVMKRMEEKRKKVSMMCGSIRNLKGTARIRSAGEIRTKAEIDVEYSVGRMHR